MNKPITITTADIYLRFPEINEEGANDLADFLEDEHIVYEGATDVFMEKDNKIEQLNNIINECADEILKELQKNHHLSYGVALAIRQKLINYRELKDSDYK